MAEGSEFVPGLIIERRGGATHEDIGGDAEPSKFLHGVLSWLCFLFANRTKNGHQRHVHKGHVLSSDPELELPQGFHVG